MRCADAPAIASSSPCSAGRNRRVRDNSDEPEVGQVVFPAAPGGSPAARECQVNVPLTRNNDPPYSADKLATTSSGMSVLE